MSASTAKSAPCLGFLTVVEEASLGLTGGYLLLNAAARPLEFHCTAPVKASRTQEILYGPTLKPYLYGEQLAETLVSKSKARPIVVLTDCPPVLAARSLIEIPLLLVLDGAAGFEAASGFALAKSRVTTAPAYAGDEQAVLAVWPHEADQFDLREPFDRIRQAIEEAQKGARQAA